MGSSALRPLRRLIVASLLLGAVIASACGGNGDGRHSIQPAANEPPPAADVPSAPPGAEPEPAPAIVVPVAPPGASPAETAQIIGQAYRELTARLFREVRPAELLGAAWRSVREEARKQGSFAADGLQPHIDAGSADVDAFAREFTLFLSGAGAGLDASRLGQAAIRGMTASIGDSHTRYVTPQQTELRGSEDGSYEGIGVITANPATAGGPGLLVREVYPGSPADLAGLRPGDRILRVDGADIQGRDQAEVSRQIRGQQGTAVNLTLQNLRGEQREVSLTRGFILPPVVTSRMAEDGIGYLKVAGFPRRSVTRDAGAEFEAQMAALQAAGARALILDLRDNPGGDPWTSVAIASNFTQDGPIFKTIDRSGRKASFPALRNRKLAGVPAVVLINGNSASGAEVVASALSEYGAAYVIGTTTCGCLSVGQPVRLDDKSEIVVTVQQAITGRYERSLEGQGLEPDEVVRSARLGGPDLQLERAVEYLQAKLQ